MNRCARLASISVVILIRTDTTLDHSQKAEKVWNLSYVKIYEHVLCVTATVCIILFVGNKSLQKLISRINAPLSRQPLVKGERLVRGEVSAAIPIIDSENSYA